MNRKKILYRPNEILKYLDIVGQSTMGDLGKCFGYDNIALPWIVSDLRIAGYITEEGYTLRYEGKSPVARKLYKLTSLGRAATENDLGTVERFVIESPRISEAVLRFLNRCFEEVPSLNMSEDEIHRLANEVFNGVKERYTQEELQALEEEVRIFFRK